MELLAFIFEQPSYASLKTKGRREIYSSEPEPKFTNGAISDILGVTKSNSPQRCTSGSAFNLCVLQNVPNQSTPKCKCSQTGQNVSNKLLGKSANPVVKGM